MAVEWNEFRGMMRRWRRNAGDPKLDRLLTRRYNEIARMQERDPDLDTTRAVMALTQDYEAGQIRSGNHYLLMLKSETDVITRWVQEANRKLFVQLDRYPDAFEIAEWLLQEKKYRPASTPEARVEAMQRALGAKAEERQAAAPTRLFQEIGTGEEAFLVGDVGAVDPALQEQAGEGELHRYAEEIAPDLTPMEVARLVRKRMDTAYVEREMSVAIPLLVFFVRTFSKPQRSWTRIHRELEAGKGTSGIPLKISLRQVKDAYGRGQRMAERIARREEV